MAKLKLNSVKILFSVKKKQFKMCDEAKKRDIHAKSMKNMQREKDIEVSSACGNIMLLNIDNDCIESICDWLPLNDLCAFSLTCKRFHRLANQYFYHRYKHHRMEIVNDLCGPRINTRERYAKCFTSNIRNIRMTSVYWNVQPIHLFTFLRMNCCENLQELELDTINFKTKSIQKYGEQIQKQLEHLSTISFINCSVYDIYNGFLRYCIRLKCLMVKEETPIPMNCTWLFHEYPCLETFIYYVPECLNVPPLTEFFRLNPHIKRVAGSGDRLLNVLSETSITLEYLMLRIEHATIFDAIFHVLKVMCKQNQVNTLKLEFGWDVKFSCKIADSIMNLQSFTALEGLSFERSTLAENELKSIFFHSITHHSCENVKSLRLDVVKPIAEVVFRLLPLYVPNLEEIHLHPWWNKCAKNLVVFIGILAAELKQLKIISIHRIDANLISTHFIVRINNARKQRQLFNTCLSIYLPYEIIQNIKFIIPVDSLVAVKPISSLKRDIYSSERRTI